MAENFTRTTGRASGSKVGRGGATIENVPYIGEVRNTVDTTYTGMVQVYIEEFSGPDKTNPSSWVSVRYVSPFYGATEHSGPDTGTGSYVGNRHSYGMWFTPPDIGTKVLCFFASGDLNQGYYIGCIPQAGLTQMIPAMGATKNLKREGAAQDRLFADIDQLPVTEINEADKTISEDTRFFRKDKPVHAYQATILHQQGLVKDKVRGTITSSAQRETPSRVFGISTPGRPIYDGGLLDEDIRARVEGGSVKPNDVKVIGRRSGHSFVMDDGDISGADQLIRLRTAKGHQILLSDDGDCLYFMHSNGHTWFEMGKEGTIDFFSSNSVNIRSHGMINFHADKDINIQAGGSVNIVATKSVQLESDEPMTFISQSTMTAHAKGKLGVLSDGSIAIKAGSSLSMSAEGITSITGSKVNLNSGGEAQVAAPNKIKKNKFPDTVYEESQGWVVKPNEIESIVTRTPTHEPYLGHNKGVEAKTDVAGAPSPTPAASTSAAVDAVQAAPMTAPAITVADFVAAPKASAPIGPISVDEVTGIIAQKAKEVGQTIADVTEKGLGKFGIPPAMLEAAGLIKPGTVAAFLSDVPAAVTGIVSSATDAATAAAEKIKAVLASGSVWTGLNGVSDLATFLASEKLQMQVQEALMTKAYEALQATGVLAAIDTAKNVASLVLAASQFGPQAIADFVTGRVTEFVGQISNTIQGIMRSAQFALDFVTKELPESLALAREGAAHVGTIARDAVDKSVSDLINNAKVTIPKFVSTVSTLG